jgi:hypothetical protein
MTGVLVIFMSVLSLAAVQPGGTKTDQDSGCRLKVAKVQNINLPQIRMSSQAAAKLEKKPSKLTFDKGIEFPNAAYFTSYLGGEKTYMVLDPNSRTLAIDMDCDNKITKKELFTGEPFEDANGSSAPVKDALLFGPIYLQLWEVNRRQQADSNDRAAEVITPRTYGVDDFNEIEGVWFYVKTRGDRFCSLYLARYWSGRIRCGAGMHSIALLDADFDGMIIPVKSADEKRGDKIAIDLDNNGMFTRPELFVLRDKMGVQGRTYRVAVQWDGSMIRLDQYQQQVAFGTMPRFSMPVNWGALTKCRAGG